MSDLSIGEIRREFTKNVLGLIGIGIIVMLVAISIIAVITIPISTFQEWNNPEKWITYPKTSIPIWANYFTVEKIPEHEILLPHISQTNSDNIQLTSEQFLVNFEFDDFPSDFVYEFELKYSDSYLISLNVLRPDGLMLNLLTTTLPFSENETVYKQRIFSTDEMIKKNISMKSDYFAFDISEKTITDVIFSDVSQNSILKGDYVFVVDTYGIKKLNESVDSRIILGGKAFGLMGTDELRRDLAVGLLWGTPLALFIGVSVAIGSVVVGLIYGVYSGYKGKKTDETMMRFNDVIYALPALPFLIILAVTISNSIFLMIGFLMIFSWVGIAKVSRSMSLQIKTRQYVEAAKIMGQKDSKIIFKHIIPQLLPYAFASIAISVPAAITTEAGLSFLGLGDPTFPTWGQILHDANTYGAAAQGFWWWIVPPGLLIAVTGLAFVFIGNALDSIVNPKLKR
tara:strand:+ start:1020 stop:2384 length:1365 start_codon:yes stop_codon:yes gene_type:complete